MQRVVLEQEPPPFGGDPLQVAAAGGHGAARVEIDRGYVVRFEVQGIRKQVGGEQHRAAAAGHGHYLVVVGVARGVTQPYPGDHLRVPGHRVEDAGFHQRLPGLRQVAGPAAAVRSARVGQLALMDQVACRRKGGPRAGGGGAHGTADVVEVQVGQHHVRHCPRFDPGGPQLRQQPPRRVGHPVQAAKLAARRQVAESGVHQHHRLAPGGVAAAYHHATGGRRYPVVGVRGVGAAPDCARHGAEHQAAVEAERDVRARPQLQLAEAHRRGPVRRHALAARGGTRRRTESGEAPGWQGATNEHIGHR